jgi:hypothetical protein
MIKAAEDLKQQQLKREQERQSVLSSRVKPLPDVDTIDDKGELILGLDLDFWGRKGFDLFTKAMKKEPEGLLFVLLRIQHFFQPSSNPSTTSSSNAWSNSKRRNT